MIEVDKLVFYKDKNRYRFGLISDDKKSITLVVNKKVIENFDKKNIFCFKYMAGNDIDSSWEVKSISAKDFIHIILTKDDRSDLIYPEFEFLPGRSVFSKVHDLIPCCGVRLNEKQLDFIEKLLNKKCFCFLQDQDKEAQR